MNVRDMSLNIHFLVNELVAAGTACIARSAQQLSAILVRKLFFGLGNGSPEATNDVVVVVVVVIRFSKY